MFPGRTPAELSLGYAEAFSHLHVGSGFSYGWGTATPEELVGAAQSMGFGSMALTDRNGLHGIPRFLRACGEHGLSPIVGAEVSVECGEVGCGHVVLLAESMAGYRSLCSLITAYRMRTEGATAAGRRNPRATLGDLAEHSPGLVCLTGAVPFGYLSSRILGGRSAEAVAGLSLLREAFGSRLYAEISDDATAGSRRRMRSVEVFAEGLGLPVVATHEVAYLRSGHHRLHEALAAASNLAALPGPGYRPTDQLHLKDAGAMARLFADRPGALRNAAEIAERCAGAVDLSGRRHMPAARLPEGVSATGRLAALAFAGVKEKYRTSGYRASGEAADRRGRLPATTREVKARLRRELSCIQELGFAPYFLVAHEAAEIARSMGIPVTGRGSAANSLVCYALGLTQPEPFGNRLLFERFMHEGRTDVPDIDLDFCSLRRDEVRSEMKARYEQFGTAVAATAVTNSLKGAVRQAARALGHPPAEIDRLSRNVPSRFRDRDLVYAGVPLGGWERALKEPQMRGHPLQDTHKYRLLLELSAGLDGRLREAGTHLGGLVIGNHQFHLSELVPLEPSGQEGLLRAQYDKDGLEYVGIPKLDLLGLRMHTALSEAGRIASARTGEAVDPYDLPREDTETYALVRTGQNVGMFQLESPGQMHLSRRLKPRRIRDTVAQISLFRPGPVRGDLVTPYVLRRNGREPYSVPLPELDEVLRGTFGLLLYQEQVLEVCNRVAGFTLAEGDGVRRAMTKDRGPGAMDAIRRKFLGGAVSRGVPRRKALEVFSWVEGFAAYGFSAAHAASFAELAYASAYMRCHHPAPFFAGLLNSQPMGFYSPRVLLNEARRAGVAVLPPDVHLSADSFAVEEDGSREGALRVGLRYCKGISRGAIDSILRERGRRPFASVADLYQRTAADSDHVAALIKGGFLDPLGDREILAHEAGRLPKKPREGSRAQPELPLPHPASWWEAREAASVGTLPGKILPTRREREERTVLGLDLARHPLRPHRDALAALDVTRSSEVLALPHRTRARAAGVLECLQCPPTKSGRPVWFLLIEDEGGLLQATIFREPYRRYGHLLHSSGAFLLEGTVEQDRRRGPSFLVEKIGDLGEATAGANAGRRAFGGTGVA
jgi:error-prone DNA polymerase